LRKNQRVSTPSGEIMKTLLTLMTAVLALSTAYAQGYAEEAKDWGASPVSRPKGAPYHAITPSTIPGAKTILTDDLKALWKDDPKLVLIDVLGGAKMIEGGVGMTGAGDDRLLGPVKDKFPKVMEGLTQGNKEAVVVFYCKNSMCWMSYNSALNAVAAGYKNVYWYRGGIDSWVASGGKTAALAPAAGW
jgi:rhodanese-related sulfurtransferase